MVDRYGYDGETFVLPKGLPYTESIAYIRVYVL